MNSRKEKGDLSRWFSYMDQLPQGQNGYIGIDKSNETQYLTGIYTRATQKCFDNAMNNWSNQGINGYQIKMMSTVEQLKSIPTNYNYNRSMEITVNSMLIEGRLNPTQLFLTIINSFKNVPYQLEPYLNMTKKDNKSFSEVSPIDFPPESESVSIIFLILKLILRILLIKLNHKESYEPHEPSQPTWYLLSYLNLIVSLTSLA